MIKPWCGMMFAQCGDYDVNDATLAASITRYLRIIDIMYSGIYIPDRVNERAMGKLRCLILQLKKKGIDLHISVDFGTFVYRTTKDTKNFGLDIS